MKLRILTLLLATLMLASCAAGSADTPQTSAATTTASPISTTVTSTTAPMTTTDRPIDTTIAPITTDTPTISSAPETTPIVPTTSTGDVPTTTDAPETTVPTTSTAPITTTQAPTTTTAKPVTTTKPPVVTTAPHTHSYGAWKTTQAATCTADGTQKRTCDCGKSETRAIDATGHDYGAWKETKAATEKAEGEETRTCKGCGKKETRAIAKLEHVHSYGEWVLTNDDFYYYETRTCKSCGATEDQMHFATEDDERLIADRVIYYINQFRAEEGNPTATKLDRLTLVAEMRSEQLVTNFAHDKDAERACYTYYQYGEHIISGDTFEIRDGERVDFDPDYIATLTPPLDVNILDYYEPPAGEAIGKVPEPPINTIDKAAYAIASGVHDSPGHWSYVGGSAPYIAVGVTKSGYRYYVCIFVCGTAEYE